MKIGNTRIDLEVGVKGAHIHYVGGSNAMHYLWIGDQSCFGCVPDKQIKRLRDWCDRILRNRNKAKEDEAKAI